jgi:hypothetical protein
MYPSNSNEIITWFAVKARLGLVFKWRLWKNDEDALLQRNAMWSNNPAKGAAILF